MKNHIRQMLRTPVQSVLIIALVMIVTVMLTVGANLWIISDRLAKTYEEDFITIGTVSQKPDAVEDEPRWDAELKGYRIYKRNRYNCYVTPEDLKFPEVTYLGGPEKRVYWGSYSPEYLHEVETMPYARGRGSIVVEFSPVEDCVPDESVKVSVTRVLGSDKKMEGSVLWLCDHNNKEPIELKADKTYAAWIEERGWRHGKRWEEAEKTYSEELEYFALPVTLTLYSPEGDKIEDSMEGQSIYEVTEGFYNTAAGKRLLSMMDMESIIFDTQPVVGTNSTDLLIPFYEMNAWVYEGRYPTKEEYDQGSTVCLAPRAFAENNGLTVGDKVMTRLYFTDARRGPDVLPNFSFWLLGLDGELLQPFEEKEYTIVGLYDHKPLAEGIGYDELIVPLYSVHDRTANIVDYGAMSAENTSFRIENGTITEFLEISARHGMDNLVFTFYDRGYSALKQGVQNLKNMSAALLVMGAAAVIVLTLQISHIYITKQTRRLSIERMMGMTGKVCRRISLTGILILLLLGTVPGVAAGTVLAGMIGMEEEGDIQMPDKQTVQMADGQLSGEGAEQPAVGQAAGDSAEWTDILLEKFSRKYSNLGMAVEMNVDSIGQTEGNLAVSFAMGFLVIVMGIGISGIKVRKIFRRAPLYLLGDGMTGR